MCERALNVRQIRVSALPVLALTAAGFCFPLSATAADIPSIPAVDAPELAAVGEHGVGTTKLELALGPSPILTAEAMAADGFEVVERRLEVHLWYPTATNDDDSTPTSYRRSLPLPGAGVVDIDVPGMAQEDAPAEVGPFPLLLVSHGFGGWGTALTNLTENLASKGYVVAAIDHNDAPADRDSQLNFPNVFINRSRDQQLVIRQLTDGAAGNGNVLSSVDPQRIGLIGYSMGGFGAVATAGAAYDPDGAPMNFLSLPTVLRAQLSTIYANEAIKAVVLLAPWGGQPSARSWSAGSLSRIESPTLIVAGDADDVSGYDAGIRWIFDNLTRSDRYLLTYRNARHNVANNPVHEYVADLTRKFQTLEYFSEPVWRTDRIIAINQHFLTAFLDLYLKGESSKRRYLTVPTTESRASRWPLDAGESVGGSYAANDEPEHWPGFQRRWALGLALEVRAAEPQSVE